MELGLAVSVSAVVPWICDDELKSDRPDGNMLQCMFSLDADISSMQKLIRFSERNPIGTEWNRSAYMIVEIIE